MGCNCSNHQHMQVINNYNHNKGDATNNNGQSSSNSSNQDAKADVVKYF